jgi:plastocyanin
MRTILPVMISTFITIGIVLSLTATFASILLFDNYIVANAQPSPNEQQTETQREVDTVVRQGTVTSTQNPIPGREEMQMATILPFRQDGTLYSGVLTYTATAPVEVVILNMQTLNETERAILNATVDGELGTLFMSQLDEQTSLSSSYIVPSYAGSPVSSASIPFVGNAVWLHTIDGTPFSATFAVNALVLPFQIQNVFNDPLETADTDTAEEAADGEAAEEVNAEISTDTETGGLTEENDDLEANEGSNGEVVVRIPQGSSSLTDDAYRPNPIEINTGDTVTWINDDFTSHTATSGTPDSGSNGLFGGTDDSPEIIGPEGDTQSYTFEEAGEFEYYCTLHPNMVGTVIVTEG